MIIEDKVEEIILDEFCFNCNRPVGKARIAGEYREENRLFKIVYCSERCRSWMEDRK